MLTLHQFIASHFNDKARWALDFKGITHERETYLPGPHVPLIKKLSGGPTTTPMLQHDAGCISGSAAIIDWLEANFPSPALYPVDPHDRAAALTWQSRLDRQLGPSTRTLFFAVLLDEPDYLCATFGETKPLIKRIAYRAFFPLARPLIAKANGVNPANIEKSFALTRDLLDEIAGAVAASGYLVAGRFSVADLTAASLLAPLANIKHPDMRRIEPMPAPVRTFLDQWTDHPAIHWVHRMYATHRPYPGRVRQ